MIYIEGDDVWENSVSSLYIGCQMSHVVAYIISGLSNVLTNRYKVPAILLALFTNR